MSNTQLYSRYIPPKAGSSITAQSLAPKSSVQDIKPSTPSTAAQPSIREDASSTYKRYVPPARPVLVEAGSPQGTTSAKKPQKRKREDTSAEDHAPLQGKARGQQEALVHPKTSTTRTEAFSEAVVGTSKSTIPEVEPHEREQSKVKKKKRRQEGHEDGRNGKSQEGAHGDVHATRHAEILPNAKESHQRAREPDAASKPPQKKHQTVLERRDKALKRSEKLAIAHGTNKHQTSEETPVKAAPEVYDLVPLPQPELKPDLPALSILSALPPWLSAPIRVSSDDQTPFTDLGLEPSVVQTLKTSGYDHAFAVQASVMRLLLPGSEAEPGDVLVSAPTGSGKTLSYLLPMVEDLSSRSGTRLRGLVILPTRDLVAQAKAVSLSCAQAFDKKPRRSVLVSTATGSENLKTEQRILLSAEDVYDPAGWEAQKRRLNAMWESSDWGSDQDEGEMLQEEAVSDLPLHVVKHKAQVDILICTPGRLVEHIKLTPGFTLDSLRWLIIDEADKLLDQSYQDWLGELLAHLPRSRTMRDRLRKVVLSATLTRDLDLLGSLQLHRPTYVMLGQEDAGQVAMAETHTLPPTLSEYAVKVSDESTKPLLLLRMLESQNLLRTDQRDTTAPPTSPTQHSSSSSEVSSSSDSDSDSTSDSTTSLDSTTSPEGPTKTARNQPPHGVLIFTSSTTTTLRLARLLALLQPSLASSIAALTSTTTTLSRQRTLRAFTRRQVSVLIASDLVSRGLDLPHLAAVVNYDVPTSVKAYVHRVGRTARATRPGSAFTLLNEREAGWWWRAIGRGDVVRRTGKVARMDRLREGITEGDAERLVAAVEELASAAATSSR